MKTNVFSLFIALSIAVMGFAKSSFSQLNLPVEVKNYAAKYFPKQKISKTEVKEENGTMKYMIRLDNDMKMEFNERKELVEIESKAKTKIPDGVIPAKTLQYVKKNYPNTHIIEWEKEDGKEKVKLNTDTKLHFDDKGNFVKKE